MLSCYQQDKLIYSFNGIIYNNKNKWTVDTAAIWVNLRNIILNKKIRCKKAHIVCFMLYSSVREKSNLCC